jgi:hypothetical protein
LALQGLQEAIALKVGTILEDSPIGLDKWMMAMWMLANFKNGVSSYEIHRSIGVTQKTAWFMLHRIRTAMSAGAFQLTTTSKCLCVELRQDAFVLVRCYY